MEMEGKMGPWGPRGRPWAYLGQWAPRDQILGQFRKPLGPQAPWARMGLGPRLRTFKALDALGATPLGPLGVL